LHLLHLTSVVLCGRTRRPSPPQCWKNHLLPFLSLASHFHSYFVWQDKETFTATVLDVNQGALFHLLHLTSILILCGRTRRPSQPQCCMDHLLPFLSLASHFHSYFVWQDKETFTATVLDVNQGGLICRCQSLQAFIPISQLNREKDTWLSPEVSCCALLCCAVLCCAVLCCAVAQAACLALPSLGTHLDRKNAIWPSVHLLPHLACRVYGDMLLFMHFINSSQQGINHMAQPGDHLLCMPCLPCFACFVFCECCASQLRKSRGMDASHQCWRFTCSACCSCSSTSHHDDDHACFACFACFGHHTSQCMVSWTQSVIQLAPLYLPAACSP